MYKSQTSLILSLLTILKSLFSILWSPDRVEIKYSTGSTICKVLPDRRQVTQHFSVSVFSLENRMIVHTYALVKKKHVLNVKHLAVIISGNSSILKNPLIS